MADYCGYALAILFEALCDKQENKRSYCAQGVTNVLKKMFNMLIILLDEDNNEYDFDAWLDSKLELEAGIILEAGIGCWNFLVRNINGR
jgi:hypothetical protein